MVFSCDDKTGAQFLFEVLDGRELQFVELLASLTVEWPLVVYELLPLHFGSGLLVWDLVIVKPPDDGFESSIDAGGLGAVVC